VVAATTVEAADGPVTVIVGVSSEEVGETVGRAAGLGLRGLPALVLALAVAIWVVVSRTLAPIEGIRAQAEGITGSELHRRVPEPPRNDEVGRLARTLNAMLGRLERSVERQRAFAADAAHELRSPIASARTQLETARTLPADEVNWSSVSAGVLEEILRMQALTEELLLLARIDAGEMHLRREPVDVDDMIDVMTAPERADGARRLVDISGLEPVQAHVDRVLVERVLRNLLDNAYRHAQTRVAVGVRRDDRIVRLTVEDDGAGIPESAREAVFERFQRLDEARDRDHGGTGLGLAIAADIVRAHGGTVQADDSPLGGARITVSLPIGDV
jgi:signal transduction histidine kinase